MQNFYSVDKLRLLLEQGQISQVVEVFEEMSASWQLLAARLEALLNTVNEAVCIVDEADRVVVWNKRSEMLYGIPAKEIMNQPIESFFSNLMLNKVIKDRCPVYEEYHAPCPEKHVLINARPITLNGQVKGGVCAERDITEFVQLNEKLSQTHREVQSLKQEINQMYGHDEAFSSIYGHSRSILEAVNIARRVAFTQAPVLLRGESGTGKELFAKAIHKVSKVKGQFIAINCGAIPVNLFESELFGYQPGAFTGADRKGKEGLLEKADGGTLLLDELGDMPKEIQVKLLRTLQDKCFYRVGGSKPIHIDVRIIAATHCNLEDMIKKGEFREDLYYRLNVVAISLPPLRERRDDIPELVHKGLLYYSTLHNKKISKVDPALMVALLQYQWPGNIRELFNVLERLVILADSDIVRVENLPPTLLRPVHPENFWQPGIGLIKATAGLEREAIAKALLEEDNNKAQAAKKLGIPRSTLYYKMKKLGLSEN